MFQQRITSSGPTTGDRWANSVANTLSVTGANQEEEMRCQGQLVLYSFMQVQQPDGAGDQQGQRGQALRCGGRAGDVGRDPGGDGEHPAFLLLREVS